jgi:hypothetical protein
MSRLKHESSGSVKGGPGIAEVPLLPLLAVRGLVVVGYGLTSEAREGADEVAFLLSLLYLYVRRH